MNARSLLLGAAAGSAVMFMLDPAAGRRRRALVRDQMVRASRKTREGLDATACDIVNRTRGVWAASRGRFSHEPISDARLVERVRARLGRVTTHPRAIDVAVVDGHVTLSGPILASEVNDVLVAAAGVRGVETVNNQLDPHDTPDVPSLQGEGRGGGSSLDILQSRWAPATRAVVGLAVLVAGAWVAANTARSPQTRGDVHATV